MNETLFTSKLKKRYFFDMLFKLCGILSIVISCLLLALMLFSIINKGYKAFIRTEIKLEISFKEHKRKGF
jgi:phosphate transport system permease protein